LNSPFGVAVDPGGNVYIADYANNRVRKINTAGVISTVAGCVSLTTACIQAGLGDAGTGTSAQLMHPEVEMQAVLHGIVLGIELRARFVDIDVGDREVVEVFGGRTAPQ
jgi:non-canonical (house-cleaning) NTP pyrophosphatase